MLQLQYLKTQFAHLPPQGTDAWLLSRRTKIGGSEMAAAMGASPYQTPGELVVNKRAGGKLVSAACTFGHLFEPLARRCILDKHGIDIHEMGAVPSTRYPVCYSPDGVAVVDGKLKLIEIKCPFRRSKLQVIPAHYLFQVQTGMSILPCEETLFFQFRFRICRRLDIGTSVKYNRWLHTESYKRCPRVPPTRWGFMHFPGDGPLQDLGGLDKEGADRLCAYQRAPHTVHYEDKNIPDTGTILGWKLFDDSKATVTRESGFLDKRSGDLWGIHGKLTLPRDAPAPAPTPPRTMPTRKVKSKKPKPNKPKSD